MGSRQKDNTLIDRYLRGELDEEQEARYRDRLEKDVLFRELHQEQEWLFRAFRRKGHEEIREQLKAVDREQREEENSLPFMDAVFGRSRTYALGMAAVMLLLLIAVGFYLYTGFETQNRYMTYYQRYFSPPEYMPAARGGTASLSQAVEAYNAGLYEKADSYFSVMNHDNALHQVLLYRAITKMRLGQYDSAADLLRDRLSTFPAKQRPEARWYLALCLLRAEKIAEATGHLNILLETETPFKREAGQLLQNLRQGKQQGKDDHK